MSELNLADVADAINLYNDFLKSPKEVQEQIRFLLSKSLGNQEQIKDNLKNPQESSYNEEERINFTQYIEIIDNNGQLRFENVTLNPQDVKKKQVVNMDDYNSFDSETKKILELSYIEQKDVNYISQELKLTESAVRYKLVNGTRKLWTFAKHPPLSADEVKNVDLFKIPIERLRFSTKTFNIIHRAEIYSLGELVNTKKEKLEKRPFFGFASEKEINQKLLSLGLPVLT